jgi:hypothetical protein
MPQSANEVIGAAAFMTSGLASYDHPFLSDLGIESPGKSAFEQRMGGRR